MMLNYLYGRWGYPLNHALKRDGVNDAARELKESQWEDAESLDARQRIRLTQLLEFAGTHVPYYAGLFRDLNRSAGDFVDPAAYHLIPVLTKDIIRRHLADLQADPGSGRRGYRNRTSGSTGESLHFITDLRSHAYRLADEYRGKTWTGFTRGDREAILWGAPMDIKRSERWRARLRGLLAGQLFLSAYDLSPQRLDEYVDAIRQFRPKLMIGYPSALEVFARHCLHAGVSLRPHPRSIIASAETLWDHQRDLFKEAFGCEVYNRYGSREMGVIAHECAAHAGLHVSSDRLLLEIVDDEGRPCPPGQWGEMLITDLQSYAMPMIRYRIADRAAWATQSDCPCGRRLPLLSGVEGRSMDVVTSPNGQRLGGTFWTILLKSRPGLEWFQVVQDSSAAITVSYVPTSGFNPAVLDYFRAQIKERLGEDIIVGFREVEKIELTDSGKHRLVISNY
jgi:phenylacetate-CoA ligase